MLDIPSLQLTISLLLAATDHAYAQHRFEAAEALDARLEGAMEQLESILIDEETYREDEQDRENEDLDGPATTLDPLRHILHSWYVFNLPYNKGYCGSFPDFFRQSVNDTALNLKAGITDTQIWAALHDAQDTYARHLHPPSPHPCLKIA